MEILHTQLVAIALSMSVPFCYGCYLDAPGGRCQMCLSDDLMRKLPGIGVEYGTDWIVRAMLSMHLAEADTCDYFEQSIADCYSETVTIGWITYDTVRAIKDLDPVSWNIAHDEWIDSQVDDGNLVTFDNGTSYYWSCDIERFIYEQSSN